MIQEFFENVKIAVPLKCLSIFWRIYEMSLINSEVNIILIWSEDCVISAANLQKLMQSLAFQK